jgi:amidase
MTDPSRMSATELTAALRRRDISSRELLDHYLTRIADDAGAVNAVVTLDLERAMAAARTADDALAAGAPTGPLCGLPMTVKDTLETAGLRTTSGAAELADHVPTLDADSVARLRAAGAVIFGKTNVPPYAADFQTANDLFGVTTNPWDPARTPGGSAGGAAAALAAGHTGFETGSDLAGSIRIPAANCGVYGLKPSHGLIPTRGHIPGPPGELGEPDLAVLGPMGRGAADLGLGLDVLAGPTSSAARAWQLRLPGPRGAELTDYRIAVTLDDPYASVDYTVLEVLTGAVAALGVAGARVEEVSLPIPLDHSDSLFQQLLAGLTSQFQPDPVIEFFQAVAHGADPEDDSALTRWARWVTQPVREWQLARERREHLIVRWADFFTDYDVLLCPVSPLAAIAHDDNPEPALRTIVVNGEPRTYLSQTVWPGLATVAHLPAAAVPVGQTRDGLPVGIQVIGPALEDRSVVDVACRLEEVLGRQTLPRDPSEGRVRTSG